MQSENSTVPFADEASLARLAYSRWEQQNAESMAEYIYRRRTVDLSVLLQKAIEEELNEKQRNLIRMRYYDNRTPTEIAQLTGLHPSTVTHNLQTAEDKLRHALRYVVEYQHGRTDDALLPLAVREAMVVSAARYRTAQTLPDRLQALRLGEKLDVPALARCVNIPPARIEQFETGQAQPDAQELVRLAAFFDISVDLLLKGDAA